MSGASLVVVPVASGVRISAGERATVSSRASLREALLRGLVPSGRAVGWTLHDLRVGEDSLLSPTARPLVAGRWLRLGQPARVSAGREVELLPWEDEHCVPLGVRVGPGVPVSLVVSLATWRAEQEPRSAEIRVALLVELPAWDRAARASLDLPSM